MFNYSVILEDVVCMLFEKIVFIFGEKCWSFEEFNQVVVCIVSGLKVLGVEFGDWVVVSCFNVFYILMIMFGVLKVGVVYVLFNIFLKMEEIVYYLCDCQVKVFFCFEGIEVLFMGVWGYVVFEMVFGCDMLIVIIVDLVVFLFFEDCLMFGQIMVVFVLINEFVLINLDDIVIIIYIFGMIGDLKGVEFMYFNVMMNMFLLCDLM